MVAALFQSRPRERGGTRALCIGDRTKQSVSVRMLKEFN